MFTLRRVLVFWAAVALVFGFVAEANAQTVTLVTMGVTRKHTDRGRLTNLQINLKDCVTEDAVNFGLTLANRGSLALEVWAGANCNDINNRTSSNQTMCNLVHSEAPNSNTPSFTIPVRDILYTRTLASGAATSSTGGASSGGAAGTADSSDADAGAVSAGGTAAVVSTLPSSCIEKSPSTGAQKITVYFMLLDSGKAMMGTGATWEPSYKLSAPAPPDTVTAKIGENELPIEFSTSSVSSDTTINGYKFYCDPPPGTTAADERGLLPEPGSTAIPNCDPSTVIVKGAQPNDDYACGKADKSANRGNATDLVNGVAYNVAVATTDTFDNVGVLSTPDCGVPQPVTGFFEAYRDAGGEAGGGFCAFSLRRQPLPLIVLLGLGTCLVLRRRRAA